MKKVLFISVLCFLFLSGLVYAKLNLGMVGAVKERVQKLDDKIEQIEKEEKEEEEERKLTEAKGALEDMFKSFGEMGAYGDENYEKAMAKCSEANTLYKDVLKSNPENSEANLGAGLTELILLSDDPQIEDSIEKWMDELPKSPGDKSRVFPRALKEKDISRVLSKLSSFLSSIATAKLPTRGMRDFAIKATKAAPTVSEMQDVIEDIILPVLDYVIARLDIVETNPAFELRIEIYEEEIEIDRTDIYLLNSAVNSLKASLCFVVSYNLDVDYDLLSSTPTYYTYYLDKSTCAEHYYPDFFELKSPSRLKETGDALDTAANKMLLAMDSVENETDDQTDDLLPKPSECGGEDWNKTKHALNQFRDCLDGPVTIDFSYYVSESTQSITVNLNAFFYTSQMPNLRDALCPAGTWDHSTGELSFEDLDADTKTPDWQDPTFNGLLPGMINEKLKAYFE